MLALEYDWSLVDACSLVRSLELEEYMLFNTFAVVSGDFDSCRIDELYCTGVLGKLNDA